MYLLFVALISHLTFDRLLLMADLFVFIFLFCLFCWLIILLSRLIRFMSYSCDIWFLSRCWCGCWLRCFFLCANRDDAILFILYCFSFDEITRYFFTIFSSYFINFLYFSIFP